MEFNEIIEFIKINNDDLTVNLKNSVTNLDQIIDGFHICIKQYNTKFSEVVHEIKSIFYNLYYGKIKL